MANKKISQLSTTSNLTNTDRLIVNDGNVETKTITYSNVLSELKKDMNIDLSYESASTKGIVKLSVGDDAVIPLASSTRAGLLSPSEKTKLDNLSEDGITEIDLGYTSASNKGTVTNSAGDNATIPVVTNTIAGLMTPTLKKKLDGLDGSAGGSGAIGNPHDINNYKNSNELSWDNAFKRCMKANNGSVYFPSLRGLDNSVTNQDNDPNNFYYFSDSFGSEHDKVGTNNPSKCLNIYGDGQNHTLIFCPNGGLKFTGLQQKYHSVTLKDFSFYGGSGDSNISIIFDDDGAGNANCHVENVGVIGGTYKQGFLLGNGDMSTFINCSVLATSTDVGFKLVGSSVSDKGDNPVNIRFDKCQVFNARFGWDVGERSEGVYIMNSIVFGALTGIKLNGQTGSNPSTAEPYYVVQNCNLDCVEYCLDIIGGMQCIITGNSFYRRPIYIDHNGDGLVTNSKNFTGVRLSGYSVDNLITHNIFNTVPLADTSKKTTGIYLQNSYHSTITGNHFLSFDNTSTSYAIDYSSTNIVYDNRILDNSGRSTSNASQIKIRSGLASRNTIRNV